MAKLQFKSLSSVGQTEQLMPKTNAEDRAAPEELLQLVGKVRQSAWIARSIGQKDPVRFHRQDLFCRRGGRDNGHFGSVLTQSPENVKFDAVIVRDDLMSNRRQQFEDLAILEHLTGLLGRTFHDRPIAT